jgi:hypothetical protein
MQRLRGFIVTGQVIAEFCAKGERRVSVQSDIPEEAIFRFAYFANERNAFICVFEHESFYPIADGALIPIFPGPHIGVTIESDNCDHGPDPRAGWRWVREMEMLLSTDEVFIDGVWMPRKGVGERCQDTFVFQRRI